MTNFILFKIGKIAVYIGPYKLAFNDPDDTVFIEEDEQE